MKAQKDVIKAWLTSIGKDREWLASKLNTTKAVVDSWFSSRGFPNDRMIAIQALMEPEESNSIIRVPFTDEQLRKASRAAGIVGSELQEYCQRAIESQAQQHLTNIELKVAEDSKKYPRED